MQSDPIDDEDNVNLYGYVGNDPINAVDPTGLWMASRLESSKPVTVDVKDTKTDKDTGYEVRETVRLRLEVGKAKDTQSEAAQLFASENKDLAQSLIKEEKEIVGLIYKHNRKESYAYTTAVVVSSIFNVNVSVDGFSSANYSASAFIHSHPYNGGSAFSGPDLNFLASSGLDGYLMGPSGRLRYLKYDRRTSRRKARRNQLRGLPGVDVCPPETGPKCY